MVAAHGQQNKLLRILNRQQPEQNLIQERENRGIRADPERQRQGRHGHEPRTASQRANGVFEIASRYVHPADDVHVSAHPFWLLDGLQSQTNGALNGHNEILKKPLKNRIVSTRGFLFKSLIARTLTSGIALLAPRVAVGVVAVALPEAQPVVVQQQEPSHPFHALPTIEMRHDEP